MPVHVRPKLHCARCRIGLLPALRAIPSVASKKQAAVVRVPLARPTPAHAIEAIIAHGSRAICACRTPRSQTLPIAAPCAARLRFCWQTDRDARARSLHDGARPNPQDQSETTPATGITRNNFVSYVQQVHLFIVHGSSIIVAEPAAGSAFIHFKIHRKSTLDDFFFARNHVKIHDDKIRQREYQQSRLHRHQRNDE